MHIMHDMVECVAKANRNYEPAVLKVKAAAKAEARKCKVCGDRNINYSSEITRSRKTCKTCLEMETGEFSNCFSIGACRWIDSLEEKLGISIQHEEH